MGIGVHPPGMVGCIRPHILVSRSVVQSRCKQAPKTQNEPVLLFPCLDVSVSDRALSFDIAARRKGQAVAVRFLLSTFLRFDVHYGHGCGQGKI